MDKEKQEQPTTIECPHCGVASDKFVQVGKAIVPSCTSCHRPIKMGLIPDNMIEHRTERSTL